MHGTQSSDDTTIAYESLGDGPALVLVSGASTSRRVHAELADLLSRDFTVVNYDRRGRGGSGDTLPYAVEREIEDLAAVIEVAGGSAAVFGNSSGAILALRAASAGLPITRLALWDPPFMLDRDAALQQAAYVARLTDLLDSGRPGDAMAWFMVSVGVPEHAIDGMRNSPEWAAMEDIAPTLLYDAAVMGDSTLSAGLADSVACPTLVLTGANGGPWADAAAHALVAKMPDARHQVLADQTHAVAWEILAGALLDFFAPSDQPALGVTTATARAARQRP